MTHVFLLTYAGRETEQDFISVSYSRAWLRLPFKTLGVGCAWGYSELYLGKKELVTFIDVLHSMGCSPPGDFICVQQCQGFALHVVGIGEPAPCMLTACSLWPFEARSLSRWQSFVKYRCVPGALAGGYQAGFVAEFSSC